MGRINKQISSCRKEDYDLCNSCFDDMGSEAEYIRMDLPLNYQNPGPSNFRYHASLMNSIIFFLLVCYLSIHAIILLYTDILLFLYLALPGTNTNVACRSCQIR